MEKNPTVVINTTSYPNFNLVLRIDLRPVLQKDWKLLKGYPRIATQEELDMYQTNITQCDDSPISIFRYGSTLSTQTITQLFTERHCYVAGSTHDKLDSECYYLSDEDIERICAVSQF